MKTPNEIKQAFECCLGIGGCVRCPYRGGNCVKDLSSDTLVYVHKLEANQHRWYSPRIDPPKVKEFFAVTKYDPEIKTYQLNEKEQHYTTEWLNIREDILYWMPIPDAPREDDLK